MKANEFRVTNFVNYNGEMFPIIFIGLDSVVLIRKDQSTFTVKLDRIKPISITDKILLSCGFKKRKSCFGYWIYEIMFQHTVFSVEEVDLGLCYFYIGNTHVTQTRNVHELQNLYFSITGEELVFSSTEP